MSNAFNLEPKENGIFILKFDRVEEKANKFTTPVMLQLDKLLDDLKNRQDIKCLLFMSGKATIFIAGADINEIEHITDPQKGYEVSRVGQKIFDKFGNLAIW